jgi:hypothetical protein
MQIARITHGTPPRADAPLAARCGAFRHASASMRRDASLFFIGLQANGVVVDYQSAVTRRRGNTGGIRRNRITNGGDPTLDQTAPALRI